MPEPVLADSITKLPATGAGRVVITGSHGGVFAAALAFKARCRATIFHDAGVGRDNAGIGGLNWLDTLGMAAATVDHRSARIGDAAQMLAQGVISHANTQARALGVTSGMGCRQAAGLLAAARQPGADCPDIHEARYVETPVTGGRHLILVDSASLVLPEDAGQVVVTGSHGAVFGADPANALRVDARLVLFNDAGGAAVSRLPALQVRGIAAATVAADSARIGDARSAWQTGVISAMNPAAVALGAKKGMTARELVNAALQAKDRARPPFP